jgi:hypothetical protein
MSNLIVQVSLEAVTRKKDKSINLRFTTQLEQTSEQLMEMDKVLDSSGVLFYKSNGNLTTEEVKELESVEIAVEGKTKSQRLRNTLYVYHKQLGEANSIIQNISFADFYASKMEEIIEHYKGKLTSD